MSAGTSTVYTIISFPLKSKILYLNQLLESTVKRRAERLDVLPEVNGGHRALGDAFRCELEFLGQTISIDKNDQLEG